MKLKNQNKRKLYVLLAAGAIALIVVGASVYYFVFAKVKPVPEQSQYPLSTSPDTSNTDTNDKQPSKATDTTPNEDIPVSSAGSVTITNLNQQNGYVNALAEVAAFTPTQCVYTFSSEGSKPVTREQQGNCSGVSIFKDEFDKVGTYTLTVSVYGNNQKLTTSKDIDIR